MRISSIYFLLLFPFFYACDKEDVESKATDFGYEYAGLQIGKSTIYRVDSIVYNDFTLPVSIDSFRYFVKQTIELEFADLEKRPSYKVLRYLKKDSLDNWNFDKAFSLHMTKNRMEKLEDNLLTIPLTFPVKENTYWNGNALNTLPYREYKYQDIDQGGNSLLQYFDSTLVVVQLEEENLLEKKYIAESYARGVGLIKREKILLQTSFQGEIESGTKVYYHLISY